MNLLICFCMIAAASATKYAGVWYPDTGVYDPYSQAMYDQQQQSRRPTTQPSYLSQYNPTISRQPVTPQKTQQVPSQAFGVGNRNTNDNENEENENYEQQYGQQNLPTNQNQDEQYESSYPAQGQAVRPQQQYPQSNVQNHQYTQTRPQTQTRPTEDGSLYFPPSSDTNDYNPYAQSSRPIKGRPSNVHNSMPSHTSDSRNSFSLELMKSVLNTGDDVVISPTSVSTLLALLSQGATSHSLQQLLGVLGFSTADQARRTYSNLMNSLTRRQSRNILEMANGAWLGKNFDLNRNFKSIAMQDFNADVRPVDFQRASIAAQKINSWVSNKTRNVIQNLLSPAQIDPSTVLMLINAIYFKGLWKSPFDPERTVRLNFSPTPVLQISTPFMHQEGAFVGGEDKELGARWLELPFENNEFSMILILPIDQHELPRMIERLNETGFNSILKTQNVIKKVVMSIPKFDLSFETELGSHLRRMGITDIFTPNSGLTGVSNDAVYVSRVIQKAAITVDEFGSKAAASTALAVNTLSLSGYWDEFHFICNQPFLAVIVDKTKTFPLFVAKVTNPISSSSSQSQRY